MEGEKQGLLMQRVDGRERSGQSVQGGGEQCRDSKGWDGDL